MHILESNHTYFDDRLLSDIFKNEVKYRTLWIPNQFSILKSNVTNKKEECKKSYENVVQFHFPFQGKN